VSAVTDLDQTVVLPRQPPALDLEQPPRPDPWVDGAAPARGSAQVGALGGTEAALTRLAWLLTAVLVGGVSLVRAGWSSLSGEELTTWRLATTPWSELRPLLADVDALTAPYYALIRAWSGVFGASEFSLRAPSLLAMVVAAASAAALVSRLVEPRAGVLTGLLFVAVPATSRYAHEAGPEALTAAFAVLSTVALVRFFERARFWRWVGYTVAVMLLGLAHGAALLLLLGHAGAVLVLRRRVLPAWTASAALATAPVALLLYTGRAPWDLPRWMAPPGFPSTSTIAVTLFGLAVVGGLVAGLALIGVSLKKPAGVFTTAAILPLSGLYPASELTGIRLSLLVLFTLPFWLGLAALALHRAPLVRGLVVVVVIAVIGLPVQLDLRSTDGHGNATRDAAEVLNEQVQEGDAIIYGPSPADQRIGRDLVARYVRDAYRPDDVLAAPESRVGGGLAVEECVDVDFCVGDAPRVWLFRGDGSEDPLEDLPAAKDGTLRVRYELTRSWVFRGASLFLFSLAPVELDRPAPR
jgi:mannosyltransferase